MSFTFSCLLGPCRHDTRGGVVSKVWLWRSGLPGRRGATLISHPAQGISGEGQSSGYLGQCLFLLLLFPERGKSVDRELVKVSSWGGRWRAGVGEGLGICTRGFPIESPLPSSQRWEERLGARGRGATSEYVLGIGTASHEAKRRKGEQSKACIRILLASAHNSN